MVPVSEPAASSHSPRKTGQCFSTIARRPRCSDGGHEGGDGRRKVLVFAILLAATLDPADLTMETALLPSGRCSIEQVAQHLGMDRRTVRRHLAGDAETFSSIVDAVRVELATRYLTTTGRPLVEVADLLGFSGLSALSRWFSGCFDCSASAWRAAHRGRLAPAR